ncbi:peptidoglycan-binding protein [Aquihabitans sp. G128]|uniref:peptidoglycan-binding domain-containing protein n=1 Tax=Aquihabitans sp. G128 TaxID=2849779 RepID=UPI001C241BCD|nr:peptidoglycan-binding domain-containing protein [Aquihabitans sp. G128]QXC59501.1 peptidoglycan-binding protein [Aquihabitans sp. G128]
MESFTVESVPVIEGATPVVTDLPVKPGVEVTEGQRLLSVTGRPLLVLVGALAGYRDIRPLDAGPDVAQLEAALVRLGLLAEPADDVYGDATKAAVRELYARAGSTALEVTPDGPSLEELGVAVVEAQAAVEAAADAGDVVAHRSAVEARRQARQAQTAFQERAGPLIPKAEVSIVPRLPMVVETIAARLGRPVAEGKVMVLRSAELVFMGALDAGFASQVKAGQVATFGGRGGSTVAGLVKSVAQEPSKEGTYSVTVMPAEAVPADLVSVDVVVQIEVLSTEKPVLTVPVAALIAQADGSTIVVQRGSDSRERKVAVTTGRDFDGMIEVLASTGRLSDGDQVVIGR